MAKFNINKLRSAGLRYLVADVSVGLRWKHPMKNWNKLLDLVINLMETAEQKFDTGADRKEWVLAMVKASTDTINYDINMDEISALIDSLCDMSKVVNAPAETTTK